MNNPLTTVALEEYRQNGILRLKLPPTVNELKFPFISTPGGYFIKGGLMQNMVTAFSSNLEGVSLDDSLMNTLNVKRQTS